MERKQIAAGNWKMNTDYNEGRELAKAVVAGLQPSDVLVVLGAPYIHLKNISSIIQDVSNIKLAAQNCHQEESGAYTGEISAAMLKSCGVDFVILGHAPTFAAPGESGGLQAQRAHNGEGVVHLKQIQIGWLHIGHLVGFLAADMSRL